jgi:hypothetical protein
MSREQPDCFKIFEHASHFHESDHRLRYTVPSDRPELIPLVAHPAMVLSAFASELYLKCLLCLEGRKVPKTHNLKKLFQNLLPDTKGRLETLWEIENRKPERQRVFNVIRTLDGGDKLRVDLLSVLDLGADAFEELRYICETGRSIFLLSDFPNLLRTVIIERKPGWGTIPAISPRRSQ